MKRILFTVMGLAVLTACSPLSPVKSNPTTKYLLQDPTPEQSNSVSHGKQNLLVSQLFASHWINTAEMAYQSQPSQINYFAQNQWAATPSAMLQPIVAHALQQSGLYHAVVQGPFAGNVEQQRLDLRIIDMQQDFTQNPSVYRFVVDAQLVNDVTDNIMRSQRFSYTIPTSSNDPQGGVEAANKAIQEWIPQLIAFCRKSPVNT